jgi:hypothetical protein
MIFGTSLAGIAIFEQTTWDEPLLAASFWHLRCAAQPTMPVIGFLNPMSSTGGYAPFAAAFRQGLGQTGYVEGRNVAIELSLGR